MDVKILARHFEPAPDFKEKTGGRLKALVEKHFNNAMEANAAITFKNNRYEADAFVKIKGISFHAHDENHPLQAAVDNALKKIEVQIKRYKEKIISSGRKNKQHE